MNNFQEQLITLENDRVLLRPLQKSDLEFLMPFALNEAEIWTYSMVPAGSSEKMKTYIQTAISARELGKEYPFVVFDKQTNSYAGSTRFYDIQNQNKSVQLGYTWYGKAFQGTGLNKHCKYLLLQFAFETLGMMRVEFRADSKNARSIAAMKSIGCSVEGLLRSTSFTLQNTRRDSIVLSILQEEWFETIKRLLEQKLS